MPSLSATLAKAGGNPISLAVPGDSFLAPFAPPAPKVTAKQGAGGSSLINLITSRVQVSAANGSKKSPPPEVKKQFTGDII
jgi:hypothetical protein